MTLSINTALEMNDGRKIPQLGLGVFRAGAGQSTVDAVTWALEAGYRHIDTAAIYGNEREVGQAIRASSVPREEIFVTTKLWNDDQGYDEARRAFDASLERLGLDAVDLYLMHWPLPGKRLDSWRAMEAIHKDGRARSIGVSNFTRRHLEELLDVATVAPAVNQYELHPFLPQQDITDACQEHGVVVEAYCPLVRAQRMDAPALAQVAAEVERTAAQVLIRWSLQKGFVVLPKSSQQHRIVENAAVYDFSLSDEQMASLDGLDDGHRIAWDPTTLD